MLIERRMTKAWKSGCDWYRQPSYKTILFDTRRASIQNNHDKRLQMLDFLHLLNRCLF
jgi:hypothetical protein